MKDELSLADILGLGARVSKWELAKDEPTPIGSDYPSSLCGRVEDFYITTTESGRHSGVRHYEVVCESFSATPPIRLGRYSSCVVEVSILVGQLIPYQGPEGIAELFITASLVYAGKLEELKAREILGKLRQDCLTRARELAR